MGLDTARSDTAPVLLQRCLDHRRDEDWQHFIHRYGEAVRDLVARACRRSRLGWRIEIEDMEQEVWVHLLTSSCKFYGRRDEDVLKFLRITARNLVIDQIRRTYAKKRCPRWRYNRWRRPLLFVQQPSPEEDALAAERRSVVRELCRRVTASTRFAASNRAALELAVVEGYSSDEICHLVGLSVSQIDSLVHRFRKRLLSYGVTLPRRRRTATKLPIGDLGAPVVTSHDETR